MQANKVRVDRPASHPWCPQSAAGMVAGMGGLLSRGCRDISGPYRQGREDMDDVVCRAMGLEQSALCARLIATTLLAIETRVLFV